MSKKNTLWRKWLDFMETNVTDGGIFSLVIPSSWMGSSPVLKSIFFVEACPDVSNIYFKLDVDVNVDSNGDGTSDNDHDFVCNQLFLYRYTPKYESTMGRIYYSDVNTSIK